MIDSTHDTPLYLFSATYLWKVASAIQESKQKTSSTPS